MGFFVWWEEVSGVITILSKAKLFGLFCFRLLNSMETLWLPK